MWSLHAAGCVHLITIYGAVQVIAREQLLVVPAVEMRFTSTPTVAIGRPVCENEVTAARCSAGWAQPLGMDLESWAVVGTIAGREAGVDVSSRLTTGEEEDGAHWPLTQESGVELLCVWRVTVADDCLSTECNRHGEAARVANIDLDCEAGSDVVTVTEMSSDLSTPAE